MNSRSPSRKGTALNLNCPDCLEIVCKCSPAWDTWLWKEGSPWIRCRYTHVEYDMSFQCMLCKGHPAPHDQSWEDLNHCIIMDDFKLWVKGCESAGMTPGGVFTSASP